MSKRARALEDEDAGCSGKCARCEDAGADAAGWLIFMHEDGGCFQHFFTQILDVLTQCALCCVDRAHNARLGPMRLELFFAGGEDQRYKTYINKATLYRRLSNAAAYDHAGAFAAAWPRMGMYTLYVSIRTAITRKLATNRAYQCAATLLRQNAHLFFEDAAFSNDFVENMLRYVPVELLSDWVEYCLPRIDFKQLLIHVVEEPIPLQREFLQLVVASRRLPIQINVRQAIESYLAAGLPRIIDEENPPHALTKEEGNLFEVLFAIEGPSSSSSSSSSEEDSSS